MGEANIAAGVIMRFIRPTLLYVLFLTACANPNITDVEPFTEGAQLPTPGGLLVGTVGWRQGEESVSSRRTGIELRNIVTGEGYRISVMTHDFRLVLPSGQYVVQRIWGSGLSLRMDRTTTEKVAPWLMNVVTLPLGGIIIPSESMDVWFQPSLTPIVIREGEALYVGALTVNLPDPLRKGSVNIRITTNDEGDETLKEFQARFPGTTRVEKQLLYWNKRQTDTSTEANQTTR
jgi:hypothetical protein